MAMANFVLPSWYGSGTAPYDAAAVCSQPWQILSTGYIPVFSGQGWVPVFGCLGGSNAFEARGSNQPLRRVYRRNWKGVVPKNAAVVV